MKYEGQINYFYFQPIDWSGLVPWDVAVVVPASSEKEAIDELPELPPGWAWISRGTEWRDPALHIELDREEIEEAIEALG